MNLIDTTMSAIRKAISTHDGKTAVMSSFGKDSMVMLYCIREAGFDLPVIYLHDPWQLHKHNHAYAVAQDWDLTVHNWPPVVMGYKHNGTRFEFVGRYQFGANCFMDIPRNVQEPQPGDRLLCGIDILRRPLANFKNEWDLILHGHKSCDIDEYLGPVPLKSDYQWGRNGDPSFYFPLREWTDADIWNTIHDCAIPYQTDRYSPNGRELDDKRFNNDYVQCCSNCINPGNPDVVFCPKFDAKVKNVHGFFPRIDMRPDYIQEVPK